jgi:hypothetical protein
MDQSSQQQPSELEYNSNPDSNSDSDSDYNCNYDSDDSDSRADLLPPSPMLQPTDSEPSSSNIKHSIGARIQAITLLELGLPLFQIIAKIGIGKSQIYRLREKALSRSWNPTISRIVEIYHIDDSSCSGRPKAS